MLNVRFGSEIAVQPGTVTTQQGTAENGQKKSFRFPLKRSLSSPLTATRSHSLTSMTLKKEPARSGSLMLVHCGWLRLFTSPHPPYQPKC